MPHISFNVFRRLQRVKHRHLFAVILAAAASIVFLFRLDVNAGITVFSGLTYERSAQPGQTYEGIIQIKNGGHLPREVKLYQTDYLFYSDGRNIYGDPGSTSRSNADWINFSPHRLSIPPDGIASVHYSIEVPDSASLAGTYWSMIMIEGEQEKAGASCSDNSGHPVVGIRQVVRYGAQIITNIGESGIRRLKFFKTRLFKKNGARTLRVNIENTGERILRPHLWAEFFGSKGTSAGKFEVTKKTLYPATSVRYNIDVSSIPPGKYKGLIVADCGGSDLFGTTYSFNFK